MLHNYLIQVKFKGVKNLLCAHGRVRQAQHLFSWRRISQSEIRNSAAAESEGGQKFLPPNPLPFCPPERSVWRAKRAISFVQKRFGFRQTNAPQSNFQEFCRPIQPREARQRTETLARRARRGSPSAGSSQRFLW